MIEKAAMRLYRARLARDKAKKDFIELRKMSGDCTLASQDRSQCYIGYSPHKDWCDVCKKGQPLYLVRKKAGIEAWSALRALMQLCKKQGRTFSDMA